MRAWQVQRHGVPGDVLRCVEVDEPDPGPGELRLRVRSAGIGLPDALMCRGSYAFSPSLPFVPGQEVCGTVDAVGAGVDVPIGTRLMAVTSFYDGHGGFAEATIARSDAAFRVPDSMRDEEAAAFRIGYSTAWIGLVRRGSLLPGEWLLVLGAAGGSGLAAMQLGVALGARVVAVVAGEAKRQLCERLGAEVIVDRTVSSVPDAVLEATGGRRCPRRVRPSRRRFRRNDGSVPGYRWSFPRRRVRERHMGGRPDMGARAAQCVDGGCLRRRPDTGRCRSGSRGVARARRRRPTRWRHARRSVRRVARRAECRRPGRGGREAGHESRPRGNVTHVGRSRRRPMSFGFQCRPTFMSISVGAWSSVRSPRVGDDRPTVVLGELEPFRRELTGFCYRMLGSGFEAEDAVQETMVRAWRNAERFEGRSSVRSWLFRIAANVCIDMHRSVQRRAIPMEMGPSSPPVESLLGATLPEATWVTPIADAVAAPENGDPAEISAYRETVRLAFVAALQRLPARQRAALILCEVLRWQVTEVAELLETSVAAINSALQRARRTLRDQPEDLPDVALEVPEAELLERYVDAFERYDVDGLVSLLRDDAVQSMPPFAMWLRGAAGHRQLDGPARAQCVQRIAPARDVGERLRGIRAVPNGPRGRLHALGAPGPGGLRWSNRQDELLSFDARP